MQLDVTEYVTTIYGKLSALYRGYRFRCRHMGANGNKYWVCTRHDVKFKSTLTTDMTGEFDRCSGKHDHPPDNAQCEVVKAIASMWKCVRDESNIPDQQIYNAEMAKLTLNDLDFVTNIPRFHSVKWVPDDLAQNINYLYLAIMDDGLQDSVSLGWRVFPKVNTHIFGVSCIQAETQILTQGRGQSHR